MYTTGKLKVYAEPVLYLKLKKFTICLKNIFRKPRREMWVVHHGQYVFPTNTTADLGTHFQILTWRNLSHPHDHAFLTKLHVCDMCPLRRVHTF